MKALKAIRIRLRIGTLWISPVLHVLLTKEDNVFVARCLDFTVSSHGKDEKDGLVSLAEAIKEYILTSIENDNIDDMFDPTHNKYWRMFNELEAKQSYKNLKKSLSNSKLIRSIDNLEKITADIMYA